MSVETLERTESTDNPTLMAHIAYISHPFKALCGARLVGLILPEETPVDCHVCAELEKALS